MNERQSCCKSGIFLIVQPSFAYTLVQNYVIPKISFNKKAMATMTEMLLKCMLKEKYKNINLDFLLTL